MPQKHNHINQRVDPELIRRYLAGELDNKAMYALERQAMDDPFLAEALEGFERHTPDQRRHLTTLENRLMQRVKGATTHRMIFLRHRWAVAAAILVLLGVGGLWIWKKEPQHGLARTEREQASEEVITDTLSYAGITGERPVPNSPIAAQQRNMAGIIGDTSRPFLANVMPAAPAVPAGPATAEQPVASVMSKPLAEESKAMASVADSVVPQTIIEEDDHRRMAIAEKPSVNTRVLQGRVKDLSNNSGLPGASVSVEGSASGAITDQQGYFAIKVDSTKDVRLVVAAIGYNSKKMAVPSNDNNVDIAIKEQSAALSEVMVAKARRKDVYQPPSPGDGQEHYREYLIKNVRYPASALAANVKGNVRVSFRVMPDGALEDVKVVRKLQPDCDAEAVRLVKEGPAWLPASDGKATRVVVDVPFHP